MGKPDRVGTVESLLILITLDKKGRSKQENSARAEATPATVTLAGTAS